MIEKIKILFVTRKKEMFQLQKMDKIVRHAMLELINGSETIEVECIDSYKVADHKVSSRWGMLFFDVPLPHGADFIFKNSKFNVETIVGNYVLLDEKYNLVCSYQPVAQRIYLPTKVPDHITVATTVGFTKDRQPTALYSSERVAVPKFLWEPLVFEQ